eukprot:3656154-Rhodomonas_salina.6
MNVAFAERTVTMPCCWNIPPSRLDRLQRRDSSVGGQLKLWYHHAQPRCQYQHIDLDRGTLVGIGFKTRLTMNCIGID